MFFLRAGTLLALTTFAISAAAACGGGDDDSATSGPDGSATGSRSASTAGSPDAGASASPGGSPGASASASGQPPGSSTAAPGGSATATATIEIITPVSAATFEPQDGEYCDTVSASSPPNSLLGLLKLDGVDAPAGTDVMIAFDGVPGPSAPTRAAGGFRVDFGSSRDSECANKEGAAISIVVGGIAYETGRKVGESAALRFDILE